MSHPATDLLNPGDIVSFRFPYSEGMAPYARPCLVLDATEDELLLAYGTSSRERANTEPREPLRACTAHPRRAVRPQT